MTRGWLCSIHMLSPPQLSTGSFAAIQNLAGSHLHSSTFVWRTNPEAIGSCSPQGEQLVKSHFQPHSNPCSKKQRKDFRIDQLCPVSEWPSNNLKQVEFTFYFKKRQSTYMRRRWRNKLPETRLLPLLPKLTSCVWSAGLGPPRDTCLPWEQDCGSRERVQSRGPNGKRKISYTVWVYSTQLCF